jgi:hypothetical protein
MQLEHWQYAKVYHKKLWFLREALNRLMEPPWFIMLWKDTPYSAAAEKRCLSVLCLF